MKIVGKTDISVLLITRGEDTVNDVLGSIANQSRLPLEVIIADSSRDKPKIRWHPPFSLSLITVPPMMGILAARAVAIKRARGAFCLLLDSTRPLRRDCLESLSKISETRDMAILAEGSLGNGLFPRLIQLDKKLVMSPSNVKRAIDGRSSFAIPRFFRTALLKSAVHRLESRLPPELFWQVRHGDHELLFQECLKESHSVGAFLVPLLDHYEDRNAFLVAKKYFGYGQSIRISRDLGLRSTSLESRKFLRDLSPLSPPEAAAVSFLYAIRGAAFFIGYVLGGFSNRGYPHRG